MKSSTRKITLLGLFLLVFPFFLDRRRRVVRRTFVEGRAEQIFGLINDLRNWPLWTVWGRDEDIEFGFEGADQGVGAVQHWKQGGPRPTTGRMIITQSLRNERVVYELEILSGTSSLRMEGFIALEDHQNQTRVTWVCKWVGGSNPYARYLDLAFGWGLRSDMDASLAQLQDLMR